MQPNGQIIWICCTSGAVGNRVYCQISMEQRWEVLTCRVWRINPKEL